jgi:RNA polymerase sigma-70 factor (ECF subfamily)
VQPEPGSPPAADLRREFETCALPLAPALYHTALRLARQPADAQDLVQETMLRAYRTFANFQPGTNARAWLFTILYSVFSNRYRREMRTRAHLPLDAPDEQFANLAADLSPTQEDRLLAAETSPEVDEALARLPEEFRSALLLVDVAELSYEEAAQALGCPVNTVRSRLFRGRKALFVHLADYARQRGFLAGT